MNTSTHKTLSKPSTGRLGSTLFGLPVAAVGVGRLTWCSLSIWESVQIADWPAVDAIVIDGGYRTNSGEDSDTYKAWGSYRYTYQGREYVSTRVAINGGSDNIGSFQRDLGGRLARAAATGEHVLDPEGDHRMAFAFALLSLFEPGVQVADPGCVKKSWPTFWSDLVSLDD